MLPTKHQAMPNILCSGWLSKSPPEKKMRRRLKLLRSKWKTRFFVLQQTKEKYELNYYKNEQSNKKKGSIDLERCNEVIESIHCDFFPNLLALKTWHKDKTRMYYLAASSQAEMKGWVHWLCFVCGINTPPQETHILELNPTLDYLTLGQTAFYPVDLRSGDFSGRPRSCSRVFSRTPDDINLSAVQQESVPEEETKQDGDTPLATVDTPFQCFIKQLSESLSLAEPEFDVTEQFLPVIQEPPANGTVTQESTANGTVTQESTANGTVTQEPTANGTPEVFLMQIMYNTELSQPTLQAPVDAVAVASFEEDNVSPGSSYLSENGGDVPDLNSSQSKMHHMSTGYGVPTSPIKTALTMTHRSWNMMHSY